MMLNEMMLTKSPRTIRIGTDSLDISPYAMGCPSMTRTGTGLGSLFNLIFCIMENS